MLTSAFRFIFICGTFLPTDYNSIINENNLKRAYLWGRLWRALWLDSGHCRCWREDELWGQGNCPTQTPSHLHQVALLGLKSITQTHTHTKEKRDKLTSEKVMCILGKKCNEEKKLNTLDWTLYRETILNELWVTMIGKMVSRSFVMKKKQQTFSSCHL